MIDFFVSFVRKAAENRFVRSFAGLTFIFNRVQNKSTLCIFHKYHSSVSFRLYIVSLFKVFE